MIDSARGRRGMGCLALAAVSSVFTFAAFGEPREPADRTADRTAEKAVVQPTDVTRVAETPGAVTNKQVTNKQDVTTERDPSAKNVDAKNVDAKNVDAKSPKLGSKLLPTTWDRWQSLKPGQRKKYVETLRRYSHTTADQRRIISEIAATKAKSPEVLSRMQKLLPKVQAFTRSLIPSEIARLKAMTPQERARVISQYLVRERLLKKAQPTTPITQ